MVTNTYFPRTFPDTPHMNWPISGPKERRGKQSSLYRPDVVTDQTTALNRRDVFDKFVDPRGDKSSTP